MKTAPLLALLALTLSASPLLVAQDKGVATPKIQTRSPQNVNPDQAEQVLTKQTNIIVLDVRTPKEFAAGHLAGATNLNFYAPNFEQKLSALDKNKSYLVHCAVGGRSAKVRDKMKDLNFKSIYHLDGGIKAWENAGKKVEK